MIRDQNNFENENIIEKYETSMKSKQSAGGNKQRRRNLTIRLKVDQLKGNYDLNNADFIFCIKLKII